MDTRRCTKCGEIKSLDQFHPDPRGRYGRVAQCKPCRHKAVRAWRATEHGRERTRLTALKRLHTPRGQAYQKKHNASAAHKASVKKYQQSPKGRANTRRLWHRHTIKSKARTKVSVGVRRGIIPRVSTLTCVHCGRPAQEYHHHNGYDEPHWLDVIPLCIPCHKNL